MEIIVVVRFAHWREIRHLWQAFLHFISKAMYCCERCITRFYEVIVFSRREIDIERHQAVIQKRINRARRLNRKLCIKFYWASQVTQTLLQHRRHLLEARSGG